MARAKSLFCKNFAKILANSVKTMYNSNWKKTALLRVTYGGI